MTIHLRLCAALALTASLLAAPAVASAETGSGEGEWLPSLRGAGGLTINPSTVDPSGFFAITAGFRGQAGDDWSGVGISGEVGWNYMVGGLPESNYLSVTAGLDVGGRVAQVGLHPTFLVGSAGGDLSLGFRVSGRLELLFGIFGIELGYEGREVLNTLYHGVHISAALDVGVILYYAFGASRWLSRHSAIPGSPRATVRAAPSARSCRPAESPGCRRSRS